MQVNVDNSIYHGIRGLKMTRALFYVYKDDDKTIDYQLYMRSTAYGETLGEEIDDILAGQSNLEVVTDEDIWSIEMDKFIYIIGGMVFYEDEYDTYDGALTKQEYYGLE